MSVICMQMDFCCQNLHVNLLSRWGDFADSLFILESFISNLCCWVRCLHGGAHILVKYIKVVVNDRLSSDPPNMAICLSD